MTEDIGKLVAGLSETQRRVLSTGFSGRDTILTLRALVAKGLMAVRAAHPTEGGFRLTPLGERVRAHLIAQEG